MKKRFSNQSGKPVFSLGQHWQNRISTASGSEHYDPLSAKERGQLKMIADKLGPLTKKVVDFVVHHWADFIARIQQDDGSLSCPSHPQVGFLLAHCEAAANMTAKGSACDTPHPFEFGLKLLTDHSQDEKVPNLAISTYEEGTKAGEQVAGRELTKEIEIKTDNDVGDIMARIRSLPSLIIPDCWLHAPELRTNDEPEFLAMFILAWIVGLRSEEGICDEKTGLLLPGWTERFAAAPDQQSYADLAQRFGRSEQDAADACGFLRDRGLITLEVRPIQQVLPTGIEETGDVLFIGPVAEKLGELQMNGAVALQQRLASEEVEEDLFSADMDLGDDEGTES